MASCKSCGSYIADGFTSCPACGTGVGQAKAKKDDSWDIYEDNGFKSREKYNEQRTGSAQAKQSYDDMLSRNKQSDYRNEDSARANRTQHDYRKDEFKASEWRGTDNGPVFRGEVVEDATTEQRLLAACSYLGWLFLVPFLIKRDDPFVKFHLNQGVLLFLLNVLKWAFGGFGGLITIGIFIFAVQGVLDALKGGQKKLPIIGDIHIIK